MKFSAEGTDQRGEIVGRMGIADKVESLRRAVQYGLDHGKKNMIVDLNVLAVALDLTTLPDILIRKPPTVAELQAILDCPERPEIVVQADGSIRAETYPGTARPMTCANCGEESTNPGQITGRGRWVCCEACHKELTT